MFILSLDLDLGNILASFGPIAWPFGLWTTPDHLSCRFGLLRVHGFIKIVSWRLRIDECVGDHIRELEGLIHGLSPNKAYKSI